MIFLIKTTLAFCSLVYELLLAQALSAFLDNTVLRYSVTIGLYMCSMGWGALRAERKSSAMPAVQLMKVETVLTFLGGSAVMALFLIDAWGAGRFVFLVLSHGLIMVIGFLTGWEIPLIFFLRDPADDSYRRRVLAFDYLGAVLGTMGFAWFFYPRIGLLATGLILAGMNAICGLALIPWAIREGQSKAAVIWGLFLGILGTAALVGVGSTEMLTEWANHLYLGGHI